MTLSEKYMEKDIIYTQSVGISGKRKKMLRQVIVRYDVTTKKGKAIGQILDGVRRLL